MARILFVDDDPLALMVLTKAVEIFGHQAIRAYTGSEGLRVACEQSPDLIFVDHRLVDMDGLQVVSALRSNTATAATPVIMLSAGQELDAKEAALSAGALEFLRKPIQLQTLQDVIQQHTRLSTPSP
jgi:CheY-like chemotaxis protein